MSKPPKKTKPAEVVPELPAPNAAEAAAIAEARQRDEKRPRPVTLGVKHQEPGALAFHNPHEDAAGWTVRMRDAFGSRSSAFTDQQIQAFCKLVLRANMSAADQEAHVNAFLALISGIAPEDELEAALAVQIAATHAASLDFLRRSMTTDRLDFMDRYVNSATKLQRTMTAQVEALGKLRRGGQQNVRVEHVHIHDGGQAVIGNVTHGGAGGTLEKAEQPNAVGTEVFEMWGENPERAAVPVPRSRG